jgi:hypothetical protein
MDDQAARLLRAHEPAMQALTSRAYQLATAALPDAVVTVDKENIGVGTGPGYQGLVFVLTPRKDYLTLGFSRGSELPDPAGLLQGSGKVHRHVKVRRPDDLDAPALRDLIAAAVTRARQ